MKGASTNVGANALGEKALEIENIGKSQNLNGIMNIFNELKESFKEFKACFVWSKIKSTLGNGLKILIVIEKFNIFSD